MARPAVEQGSFHKPDLVELIRLDYRDWREYPILDISFESIPTPPPVKPFAAE